MDGTSIRLYYYFYLHFNKKKYSHIANKAKGQLASALHKPKVGSGYPKHKKRIALLLSFHNKN
jgi:hypothetical protein